MAGLNYGYKFTSAKGIRTENREIGVSFSEKSKKWVVRVLNKHNQISTLAQFTDEAKARKMYKKHLDKTKLKK